MPTKDNRSSLITIKPLTEPGAHERTFRFFGNVGPQTYYTDDPDRMHAGIEALAARWRSYGHHVRPKVGVLGLGKPDLRAIHADTDPKEMGRFRACAGLGPLHYGPFLLARMEPMEPLDRLTYELRQWLAANGWPQPEGGWDLPNCLPVPDTQPETVVQVPLANFCRRYGATFQRIGPNQVLMWAKFWAVLGTSHDNGQSITALEFRARTGW